MDRIQVQAAVVIHLFDQFTGKNVVNNQAWIEVLDEQKVINKGNGCYVFLCPFVQEQKIRIHSQIFVEKEIILSQRENHLFKYQIVWLEPKENYPYPLQTTYLLGKLEKSKPFDEICIFIDKDKKAIRLAQDYAKGDSNVSLYGVGDEVQGSCYAICKGKDVKVMEILSVQKEDDTYVLREPLQEDYKKTETLLHRIYKGTVSENGQFFVALPDITEDTTAHIIMKKIHKSMNIKYGKKNELM